MPLTVDARTVIVASEYPLKKVAVEIGVNSHDWQASPEFGGVSRKEQLKETIFKMEHREEIADLSQAITSHHDFPKKGILFLDCTPLLRDTKRFRSCIQLFAEWYRHQEIDAVVGLESRGFLFGTTLAYELGIPFVAVRKPGKLPGPTFSVDYEKEYGVDRVEISEDALTKGERVLIIDDLIATGGSAEAAITLIRKSGAEPAAFASLLEVKGLNGRDKISIPSFTLID